MGCVGEYCAEEGPKALLVEGRDDCTVILKLCEKSKIVKDFCIYDCGNDINVLKRANALLLSPQEMEVIGIVLDADKEKVDYRWQQIRDKFQGHPYDFPDEIPRNGLILNGGGGVPRIGVWLMPNNLDVGMLEDFCLGLADKKGREAADKFVTLAEDESVTCFKQTHRSKAILYTYLAWQNPPGRSPALAILRDALNQDNDVAQNFLAWLCELFSLQVEQA